MSESGRGMGFFPRPPQTSRRVESEATEHKLPVRQTASGTIAGCIGIVLFVVMVALIGLPFTLCTAIAWLGTQVLRLRAAGWEVTIYDSHDDEAPARIVRIYIHSFAIVAACALVLVGTLLLIATIIADVTPGSLLLETLRPVWLPVWFDSNAEVAGDWLIILGRRALPLFGLWMRGTLTAMTLVGQFFTLTLAYRMAMEVFNPNWPPTFSAALAEWGPFPWLWRREPEAQTVIKEVQHTAKYEVADEGIEHIGNANNGETTTTTSRTKMTRHIDKAPDYIKTDADFLNFQVFCRGVKAGNSLSRATWEGTLGQNKHRKLIAWLDEHNMIRKGADGTWEPTSKGKAYLRAFLEPGV